MSWPLQDRGQASQSKKGGVSVSDVFLLGRLWLSAGLGTPCVPQRRDGGHDWKRGRSGHLCLDGCPLQPVRSGGSLQQMSSEQAGITQDGRNNPI